MSAAPSIISRFSASTLLAIFSCGGDPSEGMSTSDGAHGSTSKIVASTGSSGVTPTSGGSTGTVPPCPNGVVDPDEQCDDGNFRDGDGCNNDCVVSATSLAEYRVTDHSEIFDLATDSSGGVVVAGAGPWLARFGPDLSPGWSNVYGAGQGGAALGVVVSADAIFATGGVKGEGGYDVWVSRVDLGGGLAWETIGSDPALDYASEAALSAAGELLVTGVRTIEETSSLLIQQYTAGGEPGWGVTFPINMNLGLVFPLGPGLAVTQKAVVIGSERFKDGTYPELIVAYPVGGTEPTWTLDVPQSTGYVVGAAGMPDGDILAVGSSSDATTFGTRRISGKGDSVWFSEECIGDIGREVSVDGNGDVVVIGDGPGAGGRNIRLCKFSPDGRLLWGKDIDGGFGDDNGYTLAIGPENRIIFGGSATNSEGKREGWLAVYSP